MEHLTTEALARLVDEEPTAGETDHLAECVHCRGELAGLREQTEALGGLPEIRPPKGDWQVLEAQLRSEGLVQSPGLFQTLGLAQTPTWMRAAAALALYLGGTGTGMVLSSEPTPVLHASTVEEAASAVRMAEEGYMDALDQYRMLFAADGGEELMSDPIGRLAALTQLVSVSQAAVRQVPADPFLNGILTSALAERDAIARLVSSTGDSPLVTASRGNWF